MRISIAGKAKNIENKEIRKAIKIFLNQLLKTKTTKKIGIYIYLEENLYKKTGNYAEMFPLEIVIRPKEFEIVLDAGLTEKNLLVSLAHESIHIKQYVTDKMRLYSRTNDVLWRGEKYPENVNYWKSPWEIEAFEKELELYSHYKNS